MLQVVCPNCGRTYKVKEQVIDRNCRCSNCELLFRVKDNLAPARLPEEPAIEFVNPVPSQSESQQPSVPTGSRTKIAIIVLSVIALALSLNRIMHQQVGPDAPPVAASSTERADHALGSKGSSTPVEIPPVQKSDEEWSNQLRTHLTKVFDNLMTIRFLPTGDNELKEQERVIDLQKGQELFDAAIAAANDKSVRVVNWRIMAVSVKVTNGTAEVQAAIRIFGDGKSNAVLQGIFIDEDHKCTDALKSLTIPGLVTVSGRFLSHKVENDDLARNIGLYRVFFKLDEIRQ